VIAAAHYRQGTATVHQDWIFYVPTAAMKNIKILLMLYTAPKFIEETNIIVKINTRG